MKRQRTKRLVIVPAGWPCTFEECPPGPFIPVDAMEHLCFKSAHRMPDEGSGQPQGLMAFNSAGEFWCDTGYDGKATMVYPVRMEVDED